MTRAIYTIENIAGGDRRRFRTDMDGQPSDASIRHARRLGSMGFSCSDPDIHDAISQAIEDESFGFHWRDV